MPSAERDLSEGDRITYRRSVIALLPNHQISQVVALNDTGNRAVARDVPAVTDPDSSR
jgi:hypothetical protein